MKSLIEKAERVAATYSPARPEG